MGDQADGMEYFSATDTAFQAAQLPEPPLDDQHQPLGSDVWGRYVCHMLRLSGIEVKLAARSANQNEDVLERSPDHNRRLFQRSPQNQRIERHQDGDSRPIR